MSGNKFVNSFWIFESNEPKYETKNKAFLGSKLPHFVQNQGWNQSWLKPTVLTQLSFIVLSLLTVIDCQYVPTPKQIKSYFEREEIIPDVLVYGPTRELKVKYGGKECNFGTTFNATDVENPPKLGWNPDPGAYYTLVMTDPDVPNRKEPVLREYQHWLVVNIPENKTEEGQTLTEYLGVVPEQTKTLHRFVIFVYKQPEMKPMKFDEPYKDKTPVRLKRGQFYTHRFSKKYKLGHPIFGNFFLLGPVS